MRPVHRFCLATFQRGARRKDDVRASFHDVLALYGDVLYLQCRIWATSLAGHYDLACPLAQWLPIVATVNCLDAETCRQKEQL